MSFAKAFLYIIFFTFVSSCQEKARVKFSKNSFTFKADEAKVEDTTIIKWHVGPLGRQVVSKGYTFRVRLPQLERNDLDKLATEYDIDSWLIKVKKRSYSSNSILGYMYIPLILPGTQAKSKYRRHQIKSGTFYVYYAAAAISSRLEKLMCPAFEHDRLLEEVAIEPRHQRLPEFFSSKMEESTILAKVEPYSYSGNKLNAGKELTGEYSIELAFFNYKSKVKKSNFVELDEKLVIDAEKSVYIRGCAGATVPPAGMEDIDKTKLFKWKNK